MLPNPRVSQIMTSQPPVIASDERLSRVIQLFDDLHLRQVPICEGKKLVALLSDGDLKDFSLSVAFQDRPNVNAVFLDHFVGLDAVSRKDYCPLSADATLLDALEGMETLGHFCVPIVDCNHELLGTVTVFDALRYLADVPGSKDKFGRHQKMTLAKKNLAVSSIMTKEPTTVDVFSSITNAMELMESGGFRHLPVLRNDIPIGVLTRRAILKFTYSSAFGMEALDERHLLDDIIDIESVMTPDPDTVVPSTSIPEAARILLRNRTGCLLATSRGGERLEGIATEKDFMRLLRKELHAYWNPPQRGKASS